MGYVASVMNVSSSKPNVVEVDARGLEPPQPMVRILESLAQLPEGAQVCAHTDRRPMHLLAMLEERGFTATSEEQPDGSCLTHIQRQA
jgi:TusA-related sulfurtransferase